MFSGLYNAPLLVLFVFWLWLRKQELQQFSLVQTCLDALVIFVAVMRFFGSPIPPSGHALFLTHSLLTTRNRTYRIAALVMLIASVALKISWGDYQSWTMGILIGAISSAWWNSSETIFRSSKKQPGSFRSL